jgi:hypothetical protein
LSMVKNQEGKTALSQALENSHTSVAACLRLYDSHATYGDRRAVIIQELATKILKAPLDYSKSMFKHVPDKAFYFGAKITREDLEHIREEQREAADFMKKTKAKAEEAKKYLA